MIDIVDEALRAIGTRAPAAVPLVFAAGVMTSAGPCAAPRYITVAGIAHAARRPWAVIAAFVTGLVAAYVALGLALGAVALRSGFAAALQMRSGAVYASLAVLLAVAGTVTLVRAKDHREHAAPAAPSTRAGIGGVFLLGASAVLVVSPCCAPVVAAVAALTVASDRADDASLLLAAYGCGHALPVAAVAAAGIRVSHAIRSFAAAQAPPVVAGGLLFALAAFYGTLA